MKLEEARQHYYDHTGRLSDVNRQLSFAGMAIIWLLAEDQHISAYQLINCFWWPLLCFVLALTCDLLQYMFLAFFWGRFQRDKEKHIIINRDIDITAPEWINRPSVVCIFLKVFFAIAGYGFLLVHLLRA